MNVKKSNYDDYYKAKLESGMRYQDFVVDAAYQAGFVIVQYGSKAYQMSVGESRTGVEIKNDEKFASTGNLWVETAEKATQRDGPYVPAGIYSSGDWWLYVMGDYDTIFFFPRNMLQRLDKAQKNNHDLYRHLDNNTGTSQGFLFPEKDAHVYAALILTPKASVKVAKMVGDLNRLGRELHEIVKADPAQRSLFDEPPPGTRIGET